MGFVDLHVSSGCGGEEGGSTFLFAPRCRAHGSALELLVGPCSVRMTLDAASILCGHLLEVESCNISVLVLLVPLAHGRSLTVSSRRDHCPVVSGGRCLAVPVACMASPSEQQHDDGRMERPSHRMDSRSSVLFL